MTFITQVRAFEGRSKIDEFQAARERLWTYVEKQKMTGDHLRRNAFLSSEQVRKPPSIHPSSDSCVAIIIVFHDNAEDTIDCLESVRSLEYGDYHIVAVDNGSAPDQREIVLEWLRSCSPDRFALTVVDNINHRAALPATEQAVAPMFHFLSSERNLGFAGGANIGIVYALSVVTPRYVLLLNNDTIVNPHFLRYLVRAHLDQPRIGILGPAILSHGQGRVDFAGARVHMWFGGFENRLDFGLPYGPLTKTVRYVDKVEGSCMLIPRHVIEKIGLLNPEYFLYWDDNDICMRARKGGFLVGCDLRVAIEHKISSTVHRNEAMKQYYMLRNRLVFLRTYLRPWQIIVGLPGVLFASTYSFLAVLRERPSLTASLVACFRAFRDGLTSPIVPPPRVATASKGNLRLNRPRMHHDL
jgi:GT2 family glycosyltransferase